MLTRAPILVAAVASVVTLNPPGAGGRREPIILIDLAGGPLAASCPTGNGQFEAARANRDTAWLATQSGRWTPADAEAAIASAWRRAEVALGPAAGHVCLQIATEPRTPVLARMRGIAGSANMGTGVISLFVAPSLARDDWRADLSWTVAHEFHHIAARRFGGTGLDVIIREGLAHHFAWTLYPDNIHPSAAAISPEQEATAWPTIKANLGRAAGDFTTRFMFGGPAFGNEVPGWAGYTIGFRIVQSYAERHSTIPVRELAQRSAATILSGSRFGDPEEPPSGHLSDSRQ